MIVVEFVGGPHDGQFMRMQKLDRTFVFPVSEPARCDWATEGDLDTCEVRTSTVHEYGHAREVEARDEKMRGVRHYQMTYIGVRKW